MTASSGLLGRIHLWYHYSCLPQEPRTAKQETQFTAALKYLGGLTIFGRTLVLLDDVDEYLSRGWCTFEAVLADRTTQAIDLLVASPRRTSISGQVEDHFTHLPADRHHVIWRGILDTEVFGIQSPEKCMARLGLKATHDRDVPFLYNQLCRFETTSHVRADPGKIHE